MDQQIKEKNQKIKQKQNKIKKEIDKKNEILKIASKPKKKLVKNIKKQNN